MTAYVVSPLSSHKLYILPLPIPGYGHTCTELHWLPMPPLRRLIGEGEERGVVRVKADVSDGRCVGVGATNLLEHLRAKEYRQASTSHMQKLFCAEVNVCVISPFFSLYSSPLLSSLLYPFLTSRSHIRTVFAEVTAASMNSEGLNSSLKELIIKSYNRTISTKTHKIL